MRTRPDRSTPVSSASANAFTAEYLELIARRDEPVTGSEADTAGPWHLAPHPQEGWAVLRQGEDLAKGSAPAALFKHKDAARLAAAVIPCTGRRPRYRLGQDPVHLGYPILDDGQVIGHLQYYDADLLAALNVADALVSLPRDLSWLLEAAGGLALEHAGKIALDRALAEP